LVKALQDPFLVGLLAAIGAAVSPTFASASEQPLVKSLPRIGAYDNANIDVDGDHPDLNVAGGVDCLDAEAPAYACDDQSVGVGDDDQGHGTVIAGIAGAIDEYGVVGVAPGVRLWAVKVIPAALVGCDAPYSGEVC
jgi:subtilisin family serine protease